METLIMGDKVKNTEKPLRRARIMLVEDDTEIGNWLINKLGESIDETNFKWKKNLKEATEELNNKRIDIIILDLKLPDGNGVGLLKKIKNEKRSVTVYVFSVNSELSNTCLRLGASRFFDKTTDAELLINEIKARIMSD